MTPLWIVLAIAAIYAMQEYERRRDARALDVHVARLEALVTQGTRKAIADEIREYAAGNERVSMADVMRIVEGGR